MTALTVALSTAALFFSAAALWRTRHGNSTLPREPAAELSSRVHQLEERSRRQAHLIDVLLSFRASELHADFGPFADLFAGSVDAPPRYMSLLSLHDARLAVREIEHALRHPEAPRAIRALLAQDDWRAHLVAATAIVLAEDASPWLDALWSRIRAGSWASPQLLASAAQVDPDFASHAAALDLTNPKARAARDALLARPVEPDWDRGDQIALSWREAIARIASADA
ncbi:MAG: hypothetical protein H6811_12340 [Phycisphaeraceae bacterium]|nr:hypothetical protein [Phycisphaeraceae bacterium]